MQPTGQRKTRAKEVFCCLYDRAKGLFTRTLFILHGIIATYTLYTNKKKTINEHLYIVPLGFLLCIVIEGFFTLCYRKGKEHKYFWTSGFFYIASINSIIWILAVSPVNDAKLAHNTTNTTDYLSIRILPSSIQNHLIVSSRDIEKQFCELAMIIGLLITRWISPRPRSLTSEQLTTLMIHYIGNMLDIMELKESLESERIVYDNNTNYILLVITGVYTLAFFQFSLITTADPFHKSKKEDCIATVNRSTGEINKVRLSDESRKRVTDNIHTADYFYIFVMLLMHDGPFFAVRIYLFITYKIDHEMHIIFFIKNGIVCLILIYRFFLLFFDVDDSWFVDIQKSTIEYYVRHLSRDDHLEKQPLQNDEKQGFEGSDGLDDQDLIVSDHNALLTPDIKHDDKIALELDRLSQVILDLESVDIAKNENEDEDSVFIDENQIEFKPKENPDKNHDRQTNDFETSKNNENNTKISRGSENKSNENSFKDVSVTKDQQENMDQNGLIKDKNGGEVTQKLAVDNSEANRRNSSSNENEKSTEKDTKNDLSNLDDFVSELENFCAENNC